MFTAQFTLSNLFMITGFLLAMYSCVSNDIIQTLGTFLSVNKKTNPVYIWIFAASIMIITITAGWIVNNGDMSFGRLTRIPVTHHFTIIHVLPPIILLILTRFGIPVATAFLILSVFSISDLSVIGMMLTKSFIGYGLAFVSAYIIYSIIARPVERYFYYTQKEKNPEILDCCKMVFNSIFVVAVAYAGCSEPFRLPSAKSFHT